MKVMIIQPPFSYIPSQSEAEVAFLINEMQKCDDTVDLMILPEYCNAPSQYQPADFRKAIARYTEPILTAASEASQRCHAMVAVNIAYPYNEKFRNTTLLYDRNGSVVARYFKQHLPVSEVAMEEIDDSYTFAFRDPYVVEIEGLRIGFLTCYDFYFSEYIANMASKNLDIIIGSAYQRSERMDILEMLGKLCAFCCNAYLVRASVSMGAGSKGGGGSMVVAPDGQILINFGQQTGSFTYDFEPKMKYMRSNGFGNPDIRNDKYIENGRTPWVYRPGGSAIAPDDDHIPYPRICACGGLGQVAPANSLPALASAFALGAHEIGIDLQQASDGEPIAYRGATVGTERNGYAVLSELTWHEITGIDVGMKFSDNLTGLHIVRFEDILKKLSCHTIFNLQIKSHNGKRPYDSGLFNKILRLIGQYDCRRHIYISGHPDVLETAMKLAPDIKRCCIIDDKPYETIEKAVAFSCHRIQFNNRRISLDLIVWAHEKGIKRINAWTNDPIEALEFMKMGVDTILTDEYLRMKTALERNKQEH